MKTKESYVPQLLGALGTGHTLNIKHLKCLLDNLLATLCCECLAIARSMIS